MPELTPLPRMKPVPLPVTLKLSVRITCPRLTPIPNSTPRMSTSRTLFEINRIFKVADGERRLHDAHKSQSTGTEAKPCRFAPWSQVDQPGFARHFGQNYESPAVWDNTHKLG